MDTPINIKMYMKQFNNSSTMTEKDFDKPTLDAVRKAILAREDIKKYSGTYSPDNSNPNYINYDYYRMGNNMSTPDSFEDSPIGNIVNSFKSPAYRASSSIGSAYYNIDKNGNVTLNDVYNFNKGISLDNANLAYKLAHFLGTNFGKPYNVKLNLGNINQW